MALVLAIMLLAACAGQPLTRDVAAPSPRGAVVAEPDLRQPGPQAVTRSDARIVLPSGCRMAYTRLRPLAGPASPDLVVLVHGFTRDAANMAGLARHLASWGRDVVTPSLCSENFWSGEHPRNGTDLVALASVLAATRVHYAGFSAGGLAALLAAVEDPRSVSHLGLDSVDATQLGQQAAARASVPLLAVLGAPSGCNADGNGEALYGAAREAQVLRVAGAAHCDFESPSDAVCALLCATPETGHDRREVQATVRALATAALLWQSGLQPQAARWWLEAEALPGVTRRRQSPR